MNPRRFTAAVATGVLAATGAVVLSAPAAHATPLAWTSACVNDFLGAVGNSDTSVDVSVSPAKDKYTVGETVTINWKWLAYNKVPDNSPMDPIPANTTQPFGDIALTGAQTDIIGIAGLQNNPAAPKGTPLIVSDMTGTFVLTTPGAVTLTPKGYRTVTDVGIKSTTTCNPAEGQVPGAATTLTVEGAQSADPVVNGPATAHQDWTIDLTGANFAPNATPQLSLCAPDGSACDAGKFTANTLKIDGAGKLSGTASISMFVGDGSYSVKVSDGVKSARYPIAISTYVPTGDPKATANPNVGGVGDIVTVTGENWPALDNVQIAPVNKDGVIAGDVVDGNTNGHGAFSSEVTISDAGTTGIRVTYGTTKVVVPFTIGTAQTKSQSVGVNLAPGALSMTQAGDGLNFGTVTLNGEAQTVKANLNQVTVLDARGGNLGWSLTGSMTDLVAANGTDKIPAGNLAWTPACAALPGSLSTVVNGTPGALGNTPSTLCSVAGGTATSGGKFTGDAEISLTTPQFAAAGAYTGTLTLTLI